MTRPFWLCSNPNCRAIYAVNPNGHCPRCRKPNGGGWSTMEIELGQINDYLRKTENGYSHWCPGCNQMHNIPTDVSQGEPCWQFDGNLNSPFFTPSVRITGKEIETDKEGEWTGRWKMKDGTYGEVGDAVDMCCHYNLEYGVLRYHGDCTHELKGQNVPLPPLPDFMRDDWTPPTTGEKTDGTVDEQADAGAVEVDNGGSGTEPGSPQDTGGEASPDNESDSI